MKDAKQRRNIAKEILATEQSYVEYLEICDEVFVYGTILTWKVFLRSIRKANVIEENIINGIFLNLVDILNVHKGLLDEMQSLLERWTPFSSLGTTFIKTVKNPLWFDLPMQVPAFDVYAPYIQLYDHAIQLFATTLQEKPEFKTLVEQCARDPQCNMLELQDFVRTESYHC